MPSVKVTHLFRWKKIVARQSPEILHPDFMDLLCREGGQWLNLTAPLETETCKIQVASEYV